MTRRERLERKVEKRAEWADKRRTAANAVFKRNETFTGDYAFNTQPGHIPLRARIIKQNDRAYESLQVANHHDSKAAGLAQQLDKAIYSDDSDVVQAIEARIAENETKREQMKTINKLYRKGDAAGLAALGIDLETLKNKLAEAGGYWGKAPHLPYEMSNLGGRITADRKRLEYVKQQQERSAKAEASENGVTLEQCQGGYVRVTFAEKPAREILEALRGAGFHWGSGSWVGQGASLPEIVKGVL